MLVCPDHLRRELAMGRGVYSPLLPGAATACQVNACPNEAAYNWLPDVDQDEIVTLRQEKKRDAD